MRIRQFLIVAALLSGCAGGDGGPALAPLPEVTNAVPVKVLWQASLGDRVNTLSQWSDVTEPSSLPPLPVIVDAVLSPALAGGGVFAADRGGMVARFDVSTGRMLWRVDTGREISGGVGADASLVAMGTLKGEVIALDAATGNVRWRARVSSEVLAAPAVAGDLVLVRSGDSRLFALDALDGRRRWLYQRSSPSLSVRASTGLSVSRGYVYAGFAGGKMVSIALANGAVRWEATVSLPRGTTELERVTDVVGAPLVSEREVCVDAYQGRAGCFDIATGNAIWSREMSSAESPGMDARYLFVSEDRGAVQALDRAGGTSVWKQDKLVRRRLTAPFALGREVAIGDIEGNVHFLSRETGAFVGRFATDGSPIGAGMAPLENGFLVQTTDGNLYALSLK